MASPHSSSFFFCWFLFLSRASAKVCYFPNGQAAIGQTPCFPDKDASSCCNPGDFCTSTGFCFSNSVTYYSRQSCTDKSWQSNACVQDCISNKTSTWVNILTCDDTNGAKCCAYDGNCCSNTTTIDLGIVMALPFQNGDSTSSSSTASHTATTTVTGTASSASSALSSTTAFSGSLPTTTASGSSAAASSSNIEKDTIIGVAVGVPLGVLLFLAIGAFFFREHQHRRRRRKELARTIEQPLPVPANMGERHSAPRFYEMAQPEMELPVGPHQTELPSRKSQMR